MAWASTARAALEGPGLETIKSKKLNATVTTFDNFDFDFCCIFYFKNVFPLHRVKNR